MRELRMMLGGPSDRSQLSGSKEFVFNTQIIFSDEGSDDEMRRAEEEDCVADIDWDNESA